MNHETARQLHSTFQLETAGHIEHKRGSHV